MGLLARKQEFTFDAGNRLTMTVWKNSGGTAVETMTHSYDANGNDLVATNSQGTYTMTYDALNRVTVVNDLWGKTLTFTYDAVGNRTKVADSANGVLTSTYDAANNLTRLEFGGSGQTPLRTDFTYNANNVVETITRYSDLAGTSKVATSTFTYDAATHLTNLQTKDASNNNIANYTYTYDAGGRPTTQVLNSTTTTYAYDTTDQLTGDGTTTVTYDGTGNRNNGSYTTTTGNKMTSDGTWNYTYDDEGNQTRKTKISDSSYWTYVYDNKNELTEAAQYNSADVLQKKVVFKYDVFGNRDQKYYDSNGDGAYDTTQRYAYDGWNPAKGNPVGTGNFDIWADLDGGSSLTTRYLRADLVDQLMARIDSGTAYWELGDRLGSIGHVIDNNGTVKDAITYDGWGNATHSNSAFAGRYLWTGREWDTETNLQYNRARYYDPGTGRWISQDPIGFSAGDSNLYRMVRNQVTHATDPAGLTGMGSLNPQGAAAAGWALKTLGMLKNAGSSIVTWTKTAYGAISSLGTKIGTWTVKAIAKGLGPVIASVGGFVQQQWQKIQPMFPKIADWLNFGACFAAGTPLLTPTGEKIIEDFKVGDLVLSAPEDDPDGPVEPRQVEEVFVSVSPLLNLHVRGQVIRATPLHPFYVEGRGWIPTAMLQAGDLLRGYDGRLEPVDAVTDSGEVTTAYNMRVAEYHTYFVGSQEWAFSLWAHNASKPDIKLIDRIQNLTGMSNDLREIFHEELHQLILTLDGGKPTFQQMLELAKELMKQFPGK